MKRALRTGVGVIALLCALAVLPGIISRVLFVAPGVFLDIPDAMLHGEAALGAIGEWLTLALLIGLALVVERTAAKVLFVLAAVVHGATMMSDLLLLLQFLVVAESGRAAADGTVGLIFIGWLWTLGSVLFAAAVFFGFPGHRWLGWLAIVATVPGLLGAAWSLASRGSSVDDVFGLWGSFVSSVAQLAVFVGIAYVLLVRRAGSLGAVEQAHRADAVSDTVM